MPKIDPSQLLDCLDSLLGSDGGIKGETEVKRLAVLMTKFSKKLVSKCIYILILKSTEPELLAKFMAEGGWALIFQWLDEGICNNNHALICEILELLLKCPISLDRLKENNCPKVVKGLSKDSESENVKRLAGKLVEQWLKFIKSGQAAISDVAMAAASTANVTKQAITVLPSNITVVSAVALNSGSSNEIKKQNVVARKVSKSGIKLVREVSSSDEEEVPPIGSLPLYKITVRDGKSVLAKVGTKTLSLSASKKPECGVETSNAVSSVVLKSDPVSKKFRYVTKSIGEKEKSAVSECISNELTITEKSDVSESVRGDITIKHKPVTTVMADKLEGTDLQVKEKEKSLEVKIKRSSSKSDGGKGKDGLNKVVKVSKEHDVHKNDSKYKDKERKTSRELDKKKSEHKSHKSEKNRVRERERERDSKSKNSGGGTSTSSTSNREKDSSKHRDSEKNKSKDKSKKEEKEGKNLSAAEKAQIQADKDKDTLERLKTPAISLLGKIPKKSSSQSGTKSGDVSETKTPEGQEFLDKTTGEGRRLAEGRPSSKTRPKTVKTFNSKFRSTGLEEEIKPPPPRGSLKKKSVEEKRPTSKAEPSPKEGQPPEKKPKLTELVTDLKRDRIMEKPGGIKLIPPKPKPALLESDMFSDALTASTKFEPRKRKRRTSSSKDGSEPKKEVKEELSGEVSSPKNVKPSLKFYRDTLEEEEERNKENLTESKPELKTESNGDDSTGKEPGEEAQEACSPVPKLYPNGVLVVRTRKGPKKTVKWKEDSELTSVRLFELDETERVNVTRTFVDMKLMERSHEREAFQLARKLVTDDTMEERIPWGPLYEVDIPVDRRSAVEPGKSSLEKNVQYAREKTVLQEIYFHRSSIPDSPAEPDPEVHPTTDPKIIPLDDITGNTDSVSNFQNAPWPEPKPALVPQSPPQTQQLAGHAHPQQQQHPQGFVGGYSTAGGFPGFPQMGMPGMMPPGQGNWRSGDGKEMNLNMGFQANGPMCSPQMAQPPNLFNPPGPEGFPMSGPGMGGFGPGFPMPCDPSMYGPPMGGMNMAGPPQGGWTRGGGGGGPGPGSWQAGGRPFLGPLNMQPKFQKGVCHHFAKFGNCARGTSCRFMHPN